MSARMLRRCYEETVAVEFQLAGRSSGRTGGQLDLAEHRAAVLVDGQMYRVVGVETHQLDDAVKNLPSHTARSFLSLSLSLSLTHTHTHTHTYVCRLSLR